MPQIVSAISLDQQPAVGYGLFSRVTMKRASNVQTMSNLEPFVALDVAALEVEYRPKTPAKLGLIFGLKMQRLMWEDICSIGRVTTHHLVSCMW